MLGSGRSQCFFSFNPPKTPFPEILCWGFCFTHLQGEIHVEIFFWKFFFIFFVAFFLEISFFHFFFNLFVFLGLVLMYPPTLRMIYIPTSLIRPRERARFHSFLFKYTFI